MQQFCLMEEKNFAREQQRFQRKNKNQGYLSNTQGLDPIIQKIYQNNKGQKIVEEEYIRELNKLIRAKNLEYQRGQQHSLITGRKTNHIKIPPDILDYVKKDINVPFRPVRVYNQTFF